MGLSHVLAAAAGSIARSRSSCESSSAKASSSRGSTVRQCRCSLCAQASIQTVSGIGSISAVYRIAVCLSSVLRSYCSACLTAAPLGHMQCPTGRVFVVELRGRSLEMARAAPLREARSRSRKSSALMNQRRFTVRPSGGQPPRRWPSRCACHRTTYRLA